MTTSARPKPGSSRPLAERPADDPPVLVDEAIRGELAEEPEPDAEHVALRAPFVAPELGHHRQAQDGVADDDDEQHARPGIEDELEPDHDDEADRGRPAPERGRVLGQLPRSDAQPGDDPGQGVMDGRERVEEVPDRPDDGRQHGQQDPAVDPQEERRHVAGALAADDALGDDPGPADDAERARSPMRIDRRRQMAGRGQVRAVRADVADEDEQERQRDRRRGAGHVHGQGQAARVRRVEGVGEDRGGQEQGEQARRRADGRDPPGPVADHAGGGVARPRRVSRKPPTMATRASATMIGRITSFVSPADEPPSPDGDGRRSATVGEWSAPVRAEGGASVAVADGAAVGARGRRRGRGGGDGERPGPALQVAVVGRRGPLDLVVPGRQLGTGSMTQPRRVVGVEAAAGQLGPGRVAQGQAGAVRSRGPR